MKAVELLLQILLILSRSPGEHAMNHFIDFTN